jgi:EpsI family protein
MNILRSRYALILTAVLVVQGGFFYLVAEREEVIPAMAPLDTLPERIGNFLQYKQVDVDQETRDLLRADDLLYRTYVDQNNNKVDLFVAYFKTQRYGQSPHSPKNCLPGSGWQQIAVPDRPIIQLNDGRSIQVNRYIVQKGDTTSITMYWYQTHSRVIASEYSAKFWLVADALRYHRSDTSMVRITLPFEGGNIENGSRLGEEFIRTVFPELQNRMPI